MPSRRTRPSGCTDPWASRRGEASTSSWSARGPDPGCAQEPRAAVRGRPGGAFECDRRQGGLELRLLYDAVRSWSVRALSRLAIERFGRLDVAVANAGLAVNGPLEDGAVDDWDRMVDVNLRGLLHTIAAVLPAFRAAGSGHFVTIGSTSAAKWVPGQGVYAATKAAARAVTDVLRQELAPTGIRVTYVSPGFTATGFVESTRDPEERAALEARRDAIAMPPEAVADAVLFAISRPALVDVGELTIRPTVQP